MGVYLQFPLGWWAVLAIIYIPYLVLFLQRKSYKSHKELKVQLLFGLVSIIISLIIEIVAVNLSLWTYFPSNWPVTLWTAYFGGGLLSYQLIKKIEETLK